MCSLRGNKGTSLIEVLVAIMILSIAVLAALANQPQAWMVAGKTDYLGRAAGVLQGELEKNEVLIMNPNRAVLVGTNTVSMSTSGAATPLTGDAVYTVQTTIAAVGTNIWRITVGVTWPGNTAGISGSLLVTRQEPFRY